MKRKPCNIEEKLKEYRCRKEAEVKLSYNSIWERFLGKLKIPNENVTVACEFDENVLNYQKESAVVNQAEEHELRSSYSQEKQIAKKPYSSQRKAQSNEAVVLKQVSLSTHSSSMHNQTNQTSQILSSCINDRKFKWFLLFLKIVLWIVLFVFCLELECGAIYVIFSAFYLIFTNFRNGQRKSWEPSAYSVFNPGCEAIDGTLKPEQFEKEIRYGF